jgi:hypothetical protein
VPSGVTKGSALHWQEGLYESECRPHCVGVRHRILQRQRRDAATFTLTAAMSDGSSRTVTGTWRSDDMAVATVDSNG